MRTCDEATRLIALAIDGVLDAGARARLQEHLELCSSCRSEAATQELVRDLLSARPEEAPPAGFEARLFARLADERPLAWLELINWRAWSMRLLPAAAIVLAIASSIGRSQHSVPLLTDSLSRMLADGSVADSLFDRRVDRETWIDDALLGRENGADGWSRP